jgi:hypothetical protein
MALVSSLSPPVDPDSKCPALGNVQAPKGRQLDPQAATPKQIPTSDQDPLFLFRGFAEPFLPQAIARSVCRRLWSRQNHMQDAPRASARPPCRTDSARSASDLLSDLLRLHPAPQALEALPVGLIYRIDCYIRQASWQARALGTSSRLPSFSFSLFGESDPGPEGSGSDSEVLSAASSAGV